MRVIFPLLKFYQRLISPLLPASCRFSPTCSAYAIDAFSQYGIVGGALKTTRRLLRCHPFHPGGYDPA